MSSTAAVAAKARVVVMRGSVAAAVAAAVAARRRRLLQNVVFKDQIPIGRQPGAVHRWWTAVSYRWLVADAENCTSAAMSWPPGSVVQRQ
jgi:hypothetical protein